jgi:hypothetical protein
MAGTKYIFKSGVVAVCNCGFSFYRSVLTEVNALRNQLRNMHQPLI